MLFSRTSEYALQALIFLASRDEGEAVLARDIAAWLDVPGPYLSKILKDLARVGFVTSLKGRGGGFALTSSARDASLLAILERIEGPGAFKGCLLGLKKCADATACPAHETWKPLKEKVLAMLDKRTLSAMGAEVRSGRYRLHIGRSLAS